MKNFFLERIKQLMIYLYGALFLLAPFYVVRFELLGLPTNVLMVYCLILAFVGGSVMVYQQGLFGAWGSLKTIPKLFQLMVAIFLLSSITSLFIGGFDMAKFGQWLVLYALPIKLAFQLYYFARQENWDSEIIKKYLYTFLAACGILAVVQYFWLIGLDSLWWGNSNEPKRAVAFFIHPNNLALFVSPVLAFLLPDVWQKFNQMLSLTRQKLVSGESFLVLAWLLGVVALFLSLSRGGWLGLFFAGLVFVILSGNRQLKILFVGFLVLLTIFIAVVPNFRYRVILPFYGEKSSVARLSLWDTGTKMIKDSPVLGKGIHGFNYNWDDYNTDPNLEHYNFPHNFILNTWIDLGLLGLLAWLGLVGYSFWLGWRNRHLAYSLGLILYLVAMLTHGIIDIPYFKNDLALIFWLVLAISMASWPGLAKKKPE